MAESAYAQGGTVERVVEHERVSLGGRVRAALTYLVLGLISLLTIFPFLWMLSASLMGENESAVYPPRFLPKNVTSDNYTSLFTGYIPAILPFDTYIFNSIYIALLVVVGRVFACALAGYAFARLRFPGRDLAFGLLLASLMVPGVIRLIPLYHGYKAIGWLDTHAPLIVPAILANTFGTFLLRQFFMTLPVELEEAARIDGASTFTIFTRIALPLSLPAMAALAIFTFQGSWNDFTTPVIYINDIKKTTLPVGLSVFSGQFGTQYELLMAGAMIGLVPVLIVYLFFQRYFVQGIALTGIKG
jgi:multiple sugar transport system permease protein